VSIILIDSSSVFFLSRCDIYYTLTCAIGYFRYLVVTRSVQSIMLERCYTSIFTAILRPTMPRDIRLETCPRFFSLDLYFYSRTSHDTRHAASMSSSPTFSSVPYFSRESYAARMHPHRGACLCYLPINMLFPPRVAGLRVFDWSALLRARI